tara:strand:- start:143 stop:352 length:210 start_codon:yes stop_codon:yes gene_type:complete
MSTTFVTTTSNPTNTFVTATTSSQNNVFVTTFDTSNQSQYDTQTTYYGVWNLMAADSLFNTLTINWEDA